MILDIKEGNDIRVLIEQLLEKKDKIYRQRVQLTTAHMSYSGILLERIGEWIVIKSDTMYGMAEGAKKGEEIFSYQYVWLKAIVGVGFEVLEVKKDA